MKRLVSKPRPWKVRRWFERYLSCSKGSRTTRRAKNSRSDQPWAARIAADNPLIRESILLKANNEREELAPPGSSSVEQVLADGLVLSRLQKQCFELQAAAVGGDPDVIGSKLGDALHKRLSSSTRELHAATRNYQKAKELKEEISPTRPNAGVVALKLYSPNSYTRRRTSRGTA